MIRLHFADLSEVFDPETGKSCDGGYGDPETMTIYVDERLSPEMKLETIIHEAVELYCKGRIKHSKINDLSRDLTQVLSEVYNIKNIRGNYDIR